jgi:hypothetical protein
MKKLFLLLIAVGLCLGCRTMRSTLETEAVFYPENEESTALSVVVRFENFSPVAPRCD